MKYTGRILTYLRKILFFVFFTFIFTFLSVVTLSSSLLRGCNWRAINNRKLPNVMVGGRIEDREVKRRGLRLLLRVTCEILANEIAIECTRRGDWGENCMAIGVNVQISCNL